MQFLSPYLFSLRFLKYRVIHIKKATSIKDIALSKHNKTEHGIQRPAHFPSKFLIKCYIFHRKYLLVLETYCCRYECQKSLKSQLVRLSDNTSFTRISTIALCQKFINISIFPFSNSSIWYLNFFRFCIDVANRPSIFPYSQETKQHGCHTTNRNTDAIIQNLTHCADQESK